MTATKVFGAQVIALGEGSFQIVGYHGGLPGDGWRRGDEQHTVQAKAVDGKLSAEINKADIELADGEISVLVDGTTVGTLDKVDRKSPTLGAKPPSEAVVLFDGSSAENFETW